jgi:hypothetical protein
MAEKTTDISRHQDPTMLPQQSVEPKNEEAYTAAPLRLLESRADSFNRGNDGKECCAMPASIVVMADHGPGTGD